MIDKSWRTLQGGGISKGQSVYHDEYSDHDNNKSIKDAAAGLKFLEYKMFQSVGHVDHSFGGAVIANAVASIPNIISTVVSCYLNLR